MKTKPLASKAPSLNEAKMILYDDANSTKEKSQENTIELNNKLSMIKALWLCVEEWKLIISI